MISFEYDEEKSQANLEKHGIDFLAAQALWEDPDLFEIQAKSDDEPRFLVVGGSLVQSIGLLSSRTEEV